MNDVNFQPTALQELVSELNHTGKSQYNGLLFPVPTRLQINSYGLIEALTHHAGTSRNKLMNQIVEVGIEATLNSLPDDVADSIRRRADEVIQQSIAKNAGVMERGEA